MRKAPLLVAAALSMAPLRAEAFVGAVWDYVRQYQVGIDYTSSYDHVSASYETATAGGAPQYGCALTDPGRQRCRVEMQGGASSGFGLFLEQAFRRQGTFYFRGDVGFGVRYLEGRLTKSQAAKMEADGLPLREMSFGLAALVVRPYVKLGITPARTWPDVFLSLGPAAQVAMGSVSVNDDSQPNALATMSDSYVKGFVELEIVFWRFGEGALSIFAARDVSGDGEGTKFYPKGKDGMDDFRANFSRSVNGAVLGFGAKLLLDWP